MAKPKNPLFGLNVKGSLAKALSFRGRGRQTIAEKMPIPEDAKSPAQLAWRHMYQKAVALWHALSSEEKQDWESQARSRHMTGFAWFMSQCLKPNPGIYLPLQGGKMQGDIDMGSHRILDLPAPALDQEPATKKYVDDAGPAEHGPEMHTDVTRELFIPACEGYPDAGTPSGSLYFLSSVMGGINLDEPYVIFTLKVPDDFISFTSVKATWISGALSGNMFWGFDAGYAAPDEFFMQHIDTPGRGATATGGDSIINVQEPAYPLTLSELAKGDYLGIRFHREGSHANDTLNNEAYLLGVLFTYVAEQ